MTTVSAETAAETLIARFAGLEETVDEEASAIRARHRAARRRLHEDSELTETARQRMLNELEKASYRHMVALREGHATRIAALVAEARAVAFGRAPSGAALAGFRQAETAAQAVGDADTAARQMAHALDIGDLETARALARRAHDKGWRDVAYTAVDPGLLDTINWLEGRAAARPAFLRFSVR